MKPATRYRSERPVDKGAEDAIFSGVDLLLVIMVPDLFDEGEFRIGEFAGEWGERGIRDMTGMHEEQSFTFSCWLLQIVLSFLEGY